MNVSPRTAALATVSALSIAVLASATASAQEPVLSPPAALLSVEQYETPVDGWNGWLVWSRRGGDGRYALIARTPTGEGLSLPVTPQTAPIDASIGPGPDGQPLIVYSQCSSPGLQPTGCDIHRLSPITGNGGRVKAASRPDREERFPTVWGSKIAFSMSLGKGPARAGVAVVDIDGPAPKRPTVYGAQTERIGGKTVPVRSYGPRGIDLRGGRLAFSWQAQGRSDQWSLLTTNVAKGVTRQLIAARSTSSVVSQVGRPAVGPKDVIVPVLRTGGANISEIVRSNFNGRQQWTLQGGFSAAQTERYGSALTAVARTDDRDLVIVRRLASDGRWACMAASSTASGCELLRYADATNAWTRLTRASTGTSRR
ncbi:MAG: hypothetical protein WC558_11350 [Patulibacter sp.]